MSLNKILAALLVLVFVIFTLFVILAWWRFEQRDIRVGGEGGWQRPTLSSLLRLLPRRLSGRREVTAPERATVQR